MAVPWEDLTDEPGKGSTTQGSATAALALAAALAHILHRLVQRVLQIGEGLGEIVCDSATW